MFDNSVRCHVFKDFNIPFDEKGTTCGVVRSVQWVKDGVDPDEEKAKLEIRKVYTSGAEEKVGKGYSFATKEGPHELVEGLLSVGFGDTKKCIKTLSKREDFKESVENIDVDEEDMEDDGEMFDMRNLLLSIDSENDEEDDCDEES
jgi:hypothetical protein